MPNLSEFLGAIVQETTRARMLMDLESVRIAETYYQDRYLKHLPVPHFKMSEVTIEVPVAIGQVNAPREVPHLTFMHDISERFKGDLSTLWPRLLLSMQDDDATPNVRSLRSLPTYAATLSGDAGETLKKRAAASSQNIVDIVFKSEDYTAGHTMPVRLTQLADDLELTLSRELTANYSDFIKDEKGSVKRKALDDFLRLSREQFLASATVSMKQEETTIDIIGNTTELMGKADLKYITVIKMTVREHDYEWNIGDKSENGIEERHLSIE